MKWLKKQAKLAPDKKFINELTFSQTDKKITQLTEKLSNFVEFDSRAALLSENSTDFVLILFALLALNREVLLLNNQLTQKELTEQLSELEITKVFASDQFSDKLSNTISFTQVKNSPSNPVILKSNFKDDEIAVIMNTSATTGKFKSVPITWGMISKHVKASAQTLGIKENDNWLVVLPIFHVSGLSIIMRSLYNGTTATIHSKFDENQTVRLINDQKINMISLVPTLYKRIIEQISKDNKLRLILLGGEFIPQPLIARSLEKQLPVYKTYGMTETFSQSVTFNILDNPSKINSVGQPLPSVEVEIRNPDAEGRGEIWLKSPMLMPGYLNQAPQAEWFETGDIGYLDQDKFLYILNRRKDIIISGGENIYPKEIEDLLYSLPELSECALVPESDDNWGQIPVLFYSGSITEADLHGFLIGKIAKYKLPKKYIHLDELPKNASGKILRKDLKTDEN